MAKKSYFFALLNTLVFSLSPIFEAQGANGPESSPLLTQCDAPAPDSFRLTSIESDIVNLAWHPVWHDAIHTVVLFKEEDTGSWTNLEVFSNVPDSSYSIHGLSAGSYRISIATICDSNGITSNNYSGVEFKIIELTTAGRIPLNPSIVEDCSAIEYLNHEWVGFRVREIETGINNLFEIQLRGSVSLVRRVRDNPIVAVDGDGEFPVGNQRLTVSHSFQIDDKSKPLSNQEIGFVRIMSGTQPNPTIGICQDLNNPVQWKPSYEFTALTAETVVVSFPPGGSTQGMVRPTIIDGFTAQNPFSNSLTISHTTPVNEAQNVTLHLFDATGKNILTQTFDLNNSQVTLQTNQVIPGIYFLRIKSKDKIQILKVIKQ